MDNESKCFDKKEFDFDQLIRVHDNASENDNQSSFLKYKESPPEFLYKYYGNIDYVIDVIENHRIHFELPDTYNDLYDSTYLFSDVDLYHITSKPSHMRAMLYVALGDKYKTDISSFFQNRNDKGSYTYGDFIDYICSKNSTYNKKTIIDSILHIFPRDGLYTVPNNRISCFTERNDSILMWAYYANALKGVCLGFRTEKDEKLYKSVCKVKYSDYLERSDIYETLFTKSREWEHEREWRLVCTNREMEFMQTNCLESIIIGPKMDKKTFFRLVLLAHKHKLDVYRVFPSSKYIKLEVHILPRLKLDMGNYTDAEYAEMLEYYAAME